MSNYCNWAAILAGGDGRRLQSFTRKLTGDERPKQYCRLYGTHTLLQETRHRIFLNVEPERTLYVLSAAHERFYRQELPEARRWQLIEQPANRGTATGIAYTISRLRSLGAEGAVGFFPADHYYRDSMALQRAVTAAYALAQSDPHAVVLLGAEATRAETEYGWIQPAPGPVTLAGQTSFTVRRVRQFVEKPSPARAADLLAEGCLWNTLIVIGQIGAFEAMLAEAAPDTWDAFAMLRQAADAEEEGRMAEALYGALGSVDFSRDVLARTPDRLRVLNLPDAGWTDLGQPHRVMDVLADRNEVLEAPRFAAV